MAGEGWEDPPPRRAPLLVLGALAVIVVVALLVRPDGGGPGEEELAGEGRSEPARTLPTPEATADPTAGPTAPPTPDPTATPTPTPVSAFDPAARWEPMSPSPLRGGIRGPGAWDGRRLILWPGRGNGAVYAPDVDAWATLAPAPVERTMGWTATWTGEEVLYWGGLDADGEPTADGAAFDTDGFRWRTIPPAPLAPRTGHSATWGGGRLWVFGGLDADGRHLADGAVFDPATQTWEPLPAGPLSGRAGATLAWFPDGYGDGAARVADAATPERGQLLVWGGLDGGEDERGGAGLVDGARYRPGTGWTRIAPAPVALRRLSATAWTGVERCPQRGGCANLHVWGRPAAALSERDGYTYDAFRDQWEPLPLLLGQTRSDARGLWTGRVTIVFGGRDEFDRQQRHDGFVFDADRGRWRQIPGLPRPLGAQPVLAWTGEELLVWGDGEGMRLRIDDGPPRP